MLTNITKVVLQATNINHEVRFYKLDEDVWLEIINGRIASYVATDDTIIDTIEVWRLDNDAQVTLR